MGYIACVGMLRHDCPGTVENLSGRVAYGLPHNDDYTVRVRMPGGEWQDVFEYKVQVDLDKPQDASMVQFDMGSPVEVMVKRIMARCVRLPYVP